jgi:hypothetical protein
MRAPSLVGALLVACAALPAADPCPVLGVPGPDRVLIRYQGLPVDVQLAHVEVPSEPAARTACQERLARLVKNRKVEVVYKPGFGADADGAGRVQLVTDEGNVNMLLVSGGYAKYQPGSRSEPEFDDPVRKAQDHAQQSQVRLWSKQGAWAPVDAAAAAPAPAETPAEPAAPVAVAAKPASPKPAASGPFAAEIGSKYYFPSDSSEVANINPQRLIYYSDEAAAKRAGKIPRAETQQEQFPSDGSEATGDLIFARGKEVYAEAIAKGNTPERDQMYEQAFVILSKAMQVYSALCETRPDDEALAEKLRQCMQLRYGSVKQRRFE